MFKLTGKLTPKAPRKRSPTVLRNVDRTRGSGYGHCAVDANGDGTRAGRFSVTGSSIGGVVVRSLPVETSGSLRAIPGWCFRL